MNEPNQRVNVAQKKAPAKAEPPFHLRWPAPPERSVTLRFGESEDYYKQQFGLPGHDGIDFFVVDGDPVYACADGVVEHVGPGLPTQPENRSPGLGYTLSIRHRLPSAQYVTVYAHLQDGSALVTTGETVTAGQQIAKAGATGNVTLPQLHLGLMQDGASNGGYGPYIDPAPFLDLPDQKPTPKVGSTFALNDRPRGEDRLGFKDYARAFTAMLINPATQPPLTIGIYGAWGMGKSFLMRTIRETLEQPQPADAPEFCFVEFNAWVYSGSENLWAGLVSRIYERVEQRLGGDAVRAFRLGKNRRRQVRRISLRFVFSIMLTVLLALLANLDQIAKIWTELPTVLGASSVLALVLGVGSAVVNTVNFINKAYTERAQQFKQLAAQPDFRTRIGFMADIKDEIDFVTSLLEKQNAGKPIRMVIFIDDLDRCPPAKAVEVLEAIMLLLSENNSPFYMFIGLDARILVRAIEERYGKTLVEAGVSGYEYLDKIVQIPFTIPAGNEASIKNYIRSLLPRPGEDATHGQPPTGSPPQGHPAGAAAGTPLVSSPTNQPPGTLPTQTPPPPPATEISFTGDELKALDDFAKYLSRNPRRAKRIINIYRLSRILADQARAGLSPARARQLIKWVILTEQWPYRMGLIVGQCENAEQLGEGTGVKDSDTLAELYAAVGEKLGSPEGKRLLYLDDDPELFANFVTREATPITAADIRAFEQITFNLNPALGGEIRLMLAKAASPPPVPIERDDPELEAQTSLEKQSQRVDYERHDEEYE